VTRWKLTIEYDGTPFRGWQRQATGPSVQGALEGAILKFSGETVTVHGAGRTDAGVHALGQVAHADLAKPATPKTVRDALNAHLRPYPVSVLSAEEVPDDFNARFSAAKRHYLYRILNRRGPPALEAGRVWHVAVKLDVEAMQAASRHLTGLHDWTAFRAAECQARSPVRTVDAVDVTQLGETIGISVRARSFLHSQVRAFAGTLKIAGEGRIPPGEVARIRDSRDRAACGPVAPPHGLYLVRVEY
jgi:tRNA pseudouridine38-40 synthase